MAFKKQLVTSCKQAIWGEILGGNAPNYASFFLSALQKGYNFCSFFGGVGCSRIFRKSFGNGLKQKKVRESFSRLSHFVEVPSESIV